MNYQDSNRGKIQNRERARQIVDFSGLRYGNITPTDIDGLIEYHDKAVLFMEFKYKDAQVPHGQLLAIARLVTNCHLAGKGAAAFICQHNVDDCEKDIDAANTTVRTIILPYYRIKTSDGRTLKKATDAFINWIDTTGGFQ